MNGLVVLYDAHCGLCRWCRDLLAGRRQLAPLAFLPAGSPAARARYPDVDHARSLRELTVVGPGGEVWHGLDAWTMVLWALESGREWSYTVAEGPGRWAFRGLVRALEALRTSDLCDGACKRPPVQALGRA